ncbi:MAG: metallophosphoesterase family protein [Fimbriimonadia bacterium]|nr:metallophosphoesterase family protein [Fimbriimonadia bacterium]
MGNVRANAIKWLIGLLVVFSWAGISQENSQPPWQKPSPFPDRVILTWSDNPAETQSVTWRTDTTISKGLAQIAEAEAGPKFPEKARPTEAITTPLNSDSGTAHYHSATFRGLKPNTNYTYRVGDGTNWSEWYQFRTASDKFEPYTFLYFGDLQNDVRSHCPRVVRQAILDTTGARFTLHAGDLINSANRDIEWAEWFYTLGWIAASVPTVPSPGNHEYARGENDIRALTPHWRAQYTLPENGVAGLEESCYYVDFQGTRIISLNSSEKFAEQAQWLDRVLSDNPNRWTIVTFHHPIFSPAKGRDNPQLRELWKPVFDKYRVDLVLQGHDHTYARSIPSVSANARANEGGTIFVVSVTGPKQYALNRQPWMQRAASNTQFYQVIRMEQDKLTYESRTVTGELYDAFELRKRSGKPNQLVNKIPKTPDRNELGG